MDSFSSFPHSYADYDDYEVDINFQEKLQQFLLKKHEENDPIIVLSQSHDEEE